VTKKLGCPITNILTLGVEVVDDACVTITSTINQFLWMLHNIDFT